MIAQDLTQKELADLLNTTVDRIKSLATDRAKNFSIEESRILIKNLGISAEWLVTGEGGMYVETELPTGLSVDEEMLLSAYRDMSIVKRKELLKAVMSGGFATTSVVNHPVNTGSGTQNNAKKINIHPTKKDGGTRKNVKISATGESSQAGFKITNNS